MTIQLLIELFTVHWHIIILFFIVAVLYSSVGFGGGSSYLAILALTTIAFPKIRAIALLCNIVVVTGNVFLYAKSNIYNWKRTLPLTLFSVPLAFLGGFLRINQTFFFIILAITLFIAAIIMWTSKKEYLTHKENLSSLKNIFFGGFIGFISGMVGIGGGIFLAPLLHLINWDTSKKIAATASFFILLNSCSGLLGQAFNPDFIIDWKLTMILLISVFIGGQIGANMSNKLLKSSQLKKATAILIAFVSIRILYKHLF